MNVGNIKIRLFEESDLPAIEEVFREFVRFHTERDPHFRKVEGHDQMFAQYVRRNLTSPDAMMYVAEVDGRAVGYCLGIIQQKPPVYAEPVYGYVDNMAVLNKYQRRGIGGALYEHLQDWFKSRDVKRIELMVAISNEKSTSFWRKIGFKPFMEHLFME